MSITRRVALQTLTMTAATAILPNRSRAERSKRSRRGAKAVLYDQTRCVGCRQCILGCAEANGWDGTLALTDDPQLCDVAPTVMKKIDNGHVEPCFLKVQCMHCLDPACVSACMLGAMHVDADGAVVWNEDLCVGCRYCEIACPFNVPRFQWDTPAPQLSKCELCPERRARGLPPACVEQCRRLALVYGSRDAMLEEAHRRIAEHPERYNPKVYGERDGGGTSVLYLARAGVSFGQLGLPDLGEESVATLPETLQHTLYRGFAAPLLLLASLGAIVRRNTARLREEEAVRHRSDHCAPVAGKLLTPSFVTLLALTLVGVLAILWRYTAGLGVTTNLNDGYPMGLWIAFDVVTGTALACGGYAVALLVYVANRGRYHPLVRPALLTSAFGYTLAGLSVLVDIGRPWNFYRIPFFFWDWNFNSVLLEVALCIMLYTMVLWIEVSPAILEGWRESEHELLGRLSRMVAPKLERALPYLIALGLLLPTMHQSSLGSLMLIAGPKLHPLWHTPALPLLFLVSSVGMGYAAVALESIVSSRVFRRPSEVPMLRALSVPIALTLMAYAAIRVGDLVARGKLGLVTRMDGHSLLFLTELTLLLVPALVLVVRRRASGVRSLATVALLVILGGALYRFSTFLFAFNPGDGWSYFPALPEFAVTLGFVSAEILGYVVMVKRFPILRGVGAPTPPPEAARPWATSLPDSLGPAPATAGATLYAAAAQPTNGCRLPPAQDPPATDREAAVSFTNGSRLAASHGLRPTDREAAPPPTNGSPRPTDRAPHPSGEEPDHVLADASTH